MNICPRCGTGGANGDRFCGFCGYNLTVQNDSDFVTRQDLKVQDIRFDLAIVYYNEGKYAAAKQIFENVLKEHPEHTQARELYEKSRKALADARVDEP